MSHPAMGEQHQAHPGQERSPEELRVERLQNPPGEGSYRVLEKHSLFVSLSARPIRYLQRQEGKTFEGIYRPGDMLLTPADVPLFVRWQGEEDCLLIQIPDQLLQRVAQETLSSARNQLFLSPGFQIRNPSLESVAMMLLGEMHQNTGSGRLYQDSLANVLAVHLLRHHATSQPSLPSYAGGLPSSQLEKIFDHVDAHLDQEIRLEDLADLLSMSQFHFSRMFKHSTGTTPYQYLVRQRIERAKFLLKQSNRSILDIALECGFSGHSHLSKQFRQVTGMTPKAYRTKA
jgi:AraC family transcriptional regulator